MVGFGGRRLNRFGVSRLIWAIASVVLWATMALEAGAHARNENYVWINVETDRLSGRFEITFEDMRDRLGLDLPAEGVPDQAALDAVAETVAAYIQDNFAIFVDEAEIGYSIGGVGLAEGAEDRFAAFAFETVPFDVPPQVTLRNNILLSSDAPLHRSLAVVEYDRIRGADYPMDFAVLAFGPNLREQVMDFENLAPVLTPRDFIWQGFLAFTTGPEPVLFVVALLLSAVFLLRPKQQWEPALEAAPVLWHTGLMLVLFALAHSVTLALTILGVIQPNAQLVQTLIAVSIIAVAANNLYPVMDQGRWALSLFFGLFHGMGFAAVMNGLQFRLVEPAKVLLGFNIGLELGLLLMVLILLPIFYVLRDTDLYRKALYPGANLAIIAVAGYWTVTRALAL